ncbi:MAG: HD domain-containing protein [Crocinitomicaceae bacterium]|nr:HD domain-containing protein [Crocinitomicaceae bacterium]
MHKSEIIATVVQSMKEKFHGEGTGHDWYHIERVWKNAKLIADSEESNHFIVELGALLHDIADHKFVDDYEKEAEKRVRELLTPLGVPEDDIERVLHIVDNCSFKGGVGENQMQSIEGFIVQDADRLDAIGAIGIARTFAYGGKAGNMIYDPEVKPTEFKSAEEYRRKRTHTVNHFYEKLLRLKDLMNTATGKRIAQERHDYMEKFLEQFYNEWEGKS